MGHPPCNPLPVFWAFFGAIALKRGMVFGGVLGRISEEKPNFSKDRA
jgi:hypothetical protein